MNEDLLRELAELREEVKGLNAKLDNISERVLNAAHNEVFENDRISLQKGLNEVEQALNDKTETVIYEYPTDIFQKHIVKFMEKHIRYWNEKYAFNGEEEVIEFFNEVIDKGTIREK